MGAISIRRVESGNAKLLDRLADDVFNDPIDPARLDSYLESASSMLVVALDGDLVVGQVKSAVHLHPDKAPDLYVDEVGVAPTHRRRGIAGMMLDETERWAIERGCVDMWLAAEPGNAAARSLYGSFARSKPSVLYFWDL